MFNFGKLLEAEKLKNMESLEKNQQIKNRVLSYLKEAVLSGKISYYEIGAVEWNTSYDENMKMILIEETIWNKLSDCEKGDIKALYY